MKVVLAKCHSAVAIMSNKNPISGDAVNELNWHTVWFKGEADLIR